MIAAGQKAHFCAWPAMHLLRPKKACGSAAQSIDHRRWWRGGLGAEQWRWVWGKNKSFRDTRAGKDARSILGYLGHKDIRHTVRYTELSPTRFKTFWPD